MIKNFYNIDDKERGHNGIGLQVKIPQRFAKEELLHALILESRERRIDAALALRGSVDKETGGRLLEMLENSNHSFFSRTLLAIALQKIDDQAILLRLVKHAGNTTDDFLGMSASQALFGVTSETAIAGLARLVYSESPQCVRNAVQALSGSVDLPLVAKIFVDALRDASLPTKLDIVISLSLYSPSNDSIKKALCNLRDDSRLPLELRSAASDTLEGTILPLGCSEGILFMLVESLRSGSGFKRLAFPDLHWSTGIPRPSCN